jgi:hypothetical protein
MTTASSQRKLSGCTGNRGQQIWKGAVGLSGPRPKGQEDSVQGFNQVKTLRKAHHHQATRALKALPTPRRGVQFREDNPRTPSRGRRRRKRRAGGDARALEFGHFLAPKA